MIVIQCQWCTGEWIFGWECWNLFVFFQPQILGIKYASVRSDDMSNLDSDKDELGTILVVQNGFSILEIIGSPSVLLGIKAQQEAVLNKLSYIIMSCFHAPCSLKPNYSLDSRCDKINPGYLLVDSLLNEVKCTYNDPCHQCYSYNYDTKLL